MDTRTRTRQTPTATMAPEPIIAGSSNAAATTTTTTNGNAEHSLQFLNRVGSLPVVTSALESAYSLYDASKSRFHVIGNLESSIKTRVLPQLTPLVAHLQTYEPRLTQIDAIACSGLTLLETRLPILLEPTDRVLETGKRVLDERILGPVQTARQTVATQVTRSLGAASDVVEGRVTVNDLVQSALDLSEQAVDRFLPEAQTNGTSSPAATSSSSSSAAASASASARATDSTGSAEHGQHTASAASSFVRAQKLGNTVRQRLSRRTAVQLRRGPAAAAAAAGKAAGGPSTASTTTTTTSTTQLLLVTAEGLQRQLAWLASSLAVLQAGVVSTERRVAGDLGRLASHASASAQHITHSALASLHTAVGTLSSHLPVSIQRDTDYLRRLVLEQLQALRDSRGHPAHSWIGRAGQTVNATIEYVGAIQTHLLQFIAQHTPRAVARLLPTGAHSQRRHDRVVVNGTARNGVELSDFVHINGSNGHIHQTVDKPNGEEQHEREDGHDNEEEEEQEAEEEEGDDDEEEEEGENNVDKQN